jgi:hypothetical protein
MLALPAARHEGVLRHFGSNNQASSGSPGANPCAFPANQKPQAVLLVTCTVAPVVGVAAAGEARQIPSRVPPAATVEGGLASDDDAVAAEQASAQAIANTAAASRAKWMWVLVAISSSRSSDEPLSYRGYARQQTSLIPAYTLRCYREEIVPAAILLPMRPAGESQLSSRARIVLSVYG